MGQAMLLKDVLTQAFGLILVILAQVVGVQALSFELGTAELFTGLPRRALAGVPG